MIKPGPEFVVIEPIGEERSEGGIFLAGEGTEKLKRGKVIAVGIDSCDSKFIGPPDKEARTYGPEEYEFIPWWPVGSTVLYSVFAADEFAHEGKKYIVTRGKEVRAQL